MFDFTLTSVGAAEGLPAGAGLPAEAAADAVASAELLDAFHGLVDVFAGAQVSIDLAAPQARHATGGMLAGALLDEEPGAVVVESANEAEEDLDAAIAAVDPNALPVLPFIPWDAHGTDSILQPGPLDDICDALPPAAAGVPPQLQSTEVEAAPPPAAEIAAAPMPNRSLPAMESPAAVAPVAPALTSSAPPVVDLQPAAELVAVNASPTIPAGIEVPSLRSDAPETRGDVPAPVAYGEMPMPAVRGDVPAPAAHGDMPMPAARSEMPAPAAHEDMPMPAARSDMPAPAALAGRPPAIAFPAAMPDHPAPALAATETLPRPTYTNGLDQAVAAPSPAAIPGRGAETRVPDRGPHVRPIVATTSVAVAPEIVAAASADPSPAGPAVQPSLEMSDGPVRRSARPHDGELPAPAQIPSRARAVAVLAALRLERIHGLGPELAASSPLPAVTPVMLPTTPKPPVSPLIGSPPASAPHAPATFSLPQAPVSGVMLAASAPAPETVDQIVRAIRLVWARGVGEAQIRLEPDHFGELTVSVRVEHGQVIARLQSDVPAIRDWLQGNQAALRQGLADHHLSLDRFEVVAPPADADETASRDGREHRHHNEPRPRRPRRPPTDHVFDIVA